MMKQIATFQLHKKDTTSSLSNLSNPKPKSTQTFFIFSTDMTIKGKKNSKVKIVTNKKRHNYWSNIFRRKRIMSEYFSDSAFGSQSDTKIELYNPWEDEEKMQKFRAKRILEYEYDENECLPNTNLSFMNDPNNSNNINKKEKESQ